MMEQQRRLLGLLADGEMHSGSELADRLGVSRTAVWKQVGQLDAMGLTVHASAGKGYQLGGPLELLNPELIAAELSDTARRICSLKEVLWASASTSDHLLSLQPPGPGEAYLCVAEYQTAGRGRRGRQWFAPAGHGICLSVGWTFGVGPDNLGCLGLAAGVAAVRALRRAGVSGAQLKWPNDVVLDDGKLAGILIDVRGEAGGPLYVVAGLGLNYRLDAAASQDIINSGGVQPAAVEDRVTGHSAHPRNTLAGLLADELILALREFTGHGFDPFLAEWEAADYLRGQSVRVTSRNHTIEGVAEGITSDGRLRVNSDGRESLLVSGDISVRPVSDARPS